MAGAEGGSPLAVAGGGSAVADRYARQVALGVVGSEGQARIRGATLLLVGCGALGATQAELAARAGIGRLILVDRDVVELQNLQRQALYDERDASERLPKAAAAARRIRAVNAEVRVEEHVADVTSANIATFVAGADVLCDGTDNFETRFLLNATAVAVGKPYVYAGVLATHGTVMPVVPGEGPCLRCVFEEAPRPERTPSTATMGILGSAVAWVGALAFTEALKLLVGARRDEHLLHMLDVWRGTATSVRVARRPDCPICGAAGSVRLHRRG